MQQRFLFIILVLLSLSTSVFCQDYISINNDKKIEVNILEIGSEYLIYELWKSDGIKYRLNRSEITDVVFDDSMDILFRDSYPSFANSNVILKSASNRNYLVGETWVGSFWSLESSFSKNQDAAYYFFKAKRQKSVAKILGVSSLVFIGGGFALANSDNYNDFTFAVGVISVVIVGPALGTIGIITKISSINNKKRTEDAYGIRYVNQSLSHSNQELASLNLGASQNGLGLVVQF